MHVNQIDPSSVLAFVQPLFDFIDEAWRKKSSVLVHCLAGAHRAGTTGTLCLMHYCNLKPSMAIKTAKACRPVIDPIGMLPALLDKYDAAVNWRKEGGECKKCCENDKKM